MSEVWFHGLRDFLSQTDFWKTSSWTLLLNAEMIFQSELIFCEGSWTSYCILVLCHKNELGKSWVYTKVVHTGLLTAAVPKPHSLHPSSPLWSFENQGIKWPQIRNIPLLENYSPRAAQRDFMRRIHITSTVHATKSMTFHWGQNQPWALETPKR